MKILHINNNLASGGAEKLLQESLPIMCENKQVKVEVLLLTDKNNVFDKKLIEKGISINVIPIRKIYNPMNILYIRKFIINGNYDAIHVHLFPCQYWVALASRFIIKNKRPILITTEHNTTNRRRKKFFFKYIDRYIYLRYNKVISISKKTQDNLISWTKLKNSDLDRFIVINNGIDLKKFKEANPYKRSELCNEFTDNTKLICMVGRFSEQKDQKTLIKAMTNIEKNVHLLLIGEGPLQEENQKLCKRLSIDNRVHFLGFRDDVERIIKTCDIIVLSSNYEGFGLAAVEGMAAGKPVIASNVDGLREVINDEDMIFNSGDYINLSNKINYIFKDNRFYMDKSKKFQNRSEKFDIRNMVYDYIKTYNSLISKYRGE